MKKLTILLITILSALPVFGKVGIIVNKDLYANPQIQSMITTYLEYVQIIEGKSVWLDGTSFDATTDISAFKAALIDHFSNDNLEGAVLVGDLPIAMFEMEHDVVMPGVTGYSSFPCDLYFMDLDGNWLDDAHDGDWNNKAQTGYFDGHEAGSGTKDAEIWVSRMVGSSVADVGQEVSVTLDYFNRVIERMRGRDQFPANCLSIGNNYEWSNLSREVSNSLGYTENEMVFFKRPFDLASRWKCEIRKEYEYVNIFEHSSETVNEFNAGNFTSQDYTSMANNGGISNTRFYNLFACSNCRYTTHNFLGGLYAWRHKGLIAVGSTKSGGMKGYNSYNQELAVGECFGESFRRWFNASGIYDLGFCYGMTLLGAGTLKLASYPPAIEAPSDFKSVAVGPFVQLSWTDRSNNEAGFRIERAAEGGNFTEYATVGANMTGHIQKETDVGKKYYYRVQAYNNYDNSTYTKIDSAIVTTNVSLEGTATASSQYSSSFSPDKVNDGDTITRWAALNTTFPQWVSIDLGRERSISTVQVVFAFPGTAGDGNDFTVETSSDNTTWTAGLNYNPNSNTEQIQAYPLNAFARYVRITITGAPGTHRASIGEFRVLTGVEPVPPVNLTSTNDYWDQVKLSWNELSGTFSRATSYTVKRSTIQGGPYTWIESGITETTFKTTNLEMGNTYYFIVCGVNEAGEGGPSNEIQVVAPASPPSPPENLSITPNLYKDGYTLNWIDASNGKAEFFRIERRQMVNNVWTTWSNNEISGTIRTYEDVTADNTSLYEYRVFAGSVEGISGPSNTVNTAIPPPSPILDQSLQVGNTIPLHWEFGGRTHQGFIVKRSPANDFMNFVELATVGPGVRDFTDATINLGSGYCYKVCSYNQYPADPPGGLGDPGEGCSQFQFVATEFTMNAPTNASATPTSSNMIIITWNDNSTDEQGFKIERATSSTGPFTEVGSVSANITTFTANGLNAQTQYFFRVKAFNSTGYSDYSSTISATTPVQVGPTAPTNLTATAVASNQINLVWNDNSTDENRFEIERSINGGTTWSQVTSVSANIKSYNNNNLTGGITYSYRVRAGNAQGVSAWSNTASATTQAGGYGNLAIGKVATASSVLTGGYSAANVTDDNTTTRWSAENGNFPQWVKVDLGSARTVSEVEIMFKGTGTSGDCYDFTIQTSTDNVNWTTRINQSNNTNTAQTQRYGLGVSARYYRITFSDAPGTAFASINEFRLFGQ
jgi:hypothetical protein